MDRRVVITGISSITPAGFNPEEMWQNIAVGKCYIRKISRFDAGLYPSRFAGEIDGFDPERYISFRQLKKMDRFSHLTIAAVAMLLEDSRLEIDDTNREQLGLAFGNVLGGWEFAEVELRNLYTKGPGDISPYQATAWFPAAPQGHVSIRFGIKGFAKTYVADRASSSIAIGHAYRMIREGFQTMMIAGGVESPLSPYGFLCCCTSGVLSPAIRSNGYQPFGRERDGHFIAEGAALILLEELEHALARGAKIYGEVAGFETNNDGGPWQVPQDDDRLLADAIRCVLAESNLTLEEIGLIMAEGAGTLQDDRKEAKAISNVFGLRTEPVPVTVPKSWFGHTYGAASAVDLVLGLVSMKKNQILPTVTVNPDPDCNVTLVSGLLPGTIESFLVLTQGRGGLNSVIAIKNFKKERGV